MSPLTTNFLALVITTSSDYQKFVLLSEQFLLFVQQTAAIDSFWLILAAHEKQPDCYYRNLVSFPLF